MKNKNFAFALLLILAAVCLHSWEAFSFPFTDAIAYTNGNLSGQLNPETNAWTPMGTNNSTGTIDVIATNITLTYPGLSCPATNSVQFGNLGYTERVAINPPVGANPYVFSAGTIYYSYVFVVSNLLGATLGGGFCTAFTTTVGSSATQPTTGGARFYIRRDSGNTNNYDVGIGKNPSAASDVTWAPNVFVVGATNFLVASYTFNSAGTSNDVAQLWINPASTNFGAASSPAPDVTNTNGTDLQVGGNNQLESFYFRQGNAAIPIMLATDLRIGTNWASVTPPSVVAAPSLNVMVAGTSAVITWPTSFAGFRLQGTPVLISGSNAWTNVTAPTNTVGTNFSVSDALSINKNYYRLISP